MRIEINPRSLLNLENICEVLYKLHPLVLDELVAMERSLGNLLGFIDLNNLSQEERDFLADAHKEKDLSRESLEGENYTMEKEDSSKLLNSYHFHNLRKYLQLDTYEYIPIKIYVEGEDSVIGRKVRELVEALRLKKLELQNSFI